MTLVSRIITGRIWDPRNRVGRVRGRCRAPGPPAQYRVQDQTDVGRYRLDFPGEPRPGERPPREAAPAPPPQATGDVRSLSLSAERATLRRHCVSVDWPLAFPAGLCPSSGALASPC